MPHRPLVVVPAPLTSPKCPQRARLALKRPRQPRPGVGIHEAARVARAGSLPPREAARELANALRNMRATAPTSTPADLEAFLGECDARSYAPAGSDSNASLDTEFHQRAASLAREIAEGA